MKKSLINEITIKSQSKKVIPTNTKNIDDNIVQIHNEVVNKSDLAVLQRNSVISLGDQIRGFQSNSFNCFSFNKNKSILDHNNSSLVINNHEPSQISNNNGFVTANTENKITNASINSFINERSNSILSSSSIKSIKIQSKMNPRVSIIQRLHLSKKPNFKENSKRCSLFMTETNCNDDKLEDIEDFGESSEDSNSEENLDSSGEFTKIMKKSGLPNKHSIWSKNLSTFDRSNSIYSLTDINRLKEAFFNKETNIDSTLKEKENESTFDNYNNKDRSAEDDKYREQLLDYLKINEYLMIYQKIYKNEITAKELIKLDAEKIGEMVEPENKEIKLPNLIKFILNFEDSCDYDDLFKKIDNDIFKGQSILFNIDENNSISRNQI